ncbi:uncharacterized protein J8A68_001154 [[Candida] subhashii]|uniref:Amino acid permease/ SLC12A domain-containing protein n=1 Tax=[Candida] subhashii TaxID=561895 RepID=A0A8J5QIU2_9ASCO|nr:uncharacterized protein J8A68_001154 [[Candida] subhashii]KAG7665466.1 hypothetical protein J8A68_001154 [[Candida] subhashii]
MDYEKQQRPQYAKGPSYGETETYHSTSQESYNSPTPAPTPQGAFARFIDSFKPMDLEEEGYDPSELNLTQRTVIATSKHPLAQKLKARHLQMIAIGGSIGTGLFVGSGWALYAGGPGFLLLGYLIIGYCLLCVMYALGELSVQFPVSGSFNAFFSRFVDPSWGFTLGIMYACSWIVSYPSELIAASMTIGYWNKSINPALWVAIFYVFIASVNLFGVKGYGEVEFVLSIVKIIAVFGFIICGICVIAGAGDGGYIGGKYWHNPGAFNNGLKGLCTVFITSAFSFGGIELVALAAAESVNPRKALPKATKQVFWRIFLFYILTAIVIGSLVPYTNPDLLSGDGPTASPFVIALYEAGIKVAPSIMNGTILAAVVSVGNSSVYGSSRTLCSLAAQGLLPKIVAYVDKRGRPLVAIMISNAVGLLGFLVVNENQGEVFTWFYSVCSLSAFFTWGFICFTHIRWRSALNAQGRTLDEVAFVSPFGIVGSYSGMLILAFVIGGEIWTAIYPIGSDTPQIVTFFQYCLSLPLLLIIFAIHKTVCGWRSFMVSLEDIDLDTGRRDVDIQQLRFEIAEEKRLLQERSIFYRIYNFFC